MSCVECKCAEAPVVTIDDFVRERKTLTVHSYINTKGKMVLTRDETALLLIELYKFIND